MAMAGRGIWEESDALSICSVPPPYFHNQSYRPASPTPSYRTTDPNRIENDADGPSKTINRSGRRRSSCVLSLFRRSVDHVSVCSVLYTAIEENKPGPIKSILSNPIRRATLETTQLEDIMYWVATTGDLPTLKALLKSKLSNIDRLLREESNMLHLAASRTDFHFMFELIQNGATVNARDKFGNTALHIAAQRAHGVAGCFRTLKMFGVHLEARNSLGSTALHVAAEAGILSSVRALLVYGADANAVDRQWHTPLHWATGALSGDDGGGAEPIELVRGRNDAMDTFTQGGDEKWSNVHEDHLGDGDDAVARVIAALAKDGADLNTPNFLKMTPLHLAATVDAAAVRELLRQGADAHARDVQMKTPLHAAANTENFVAGAQAVKELLAQGADACAADYLGATPLHSAAAWSVPALRELLKSDIDVDVQDIHKSTPLHYAARANKGKAVEALLENGAEVDAADAEGHTALVKCVVHKASPEVYCLLMKWGAQVYRQDFAGNTVLNHAVRCSWGHPPSELLAELRNNHNAPVQSYQ